jgi:hypothetical protein
MNRISRQIMQETGSEPDLATLAVKMEMPENKVREIMKIAKEPISMETPMGEDGDSQLGDFIEDNTTLAPLDAALHASMRNVIKEVLDSDAARSEVLRMRLRRGNVERPPLEEVGKQFDVTRERIRQIEAKAMSKLRQPPVGQVNVPDAELGSLSVPRRDLRLRYLAKVRSASRPQCTSARDGSVRRRGVVEYVGRRREPRRPPVPRSARKCMRWPARPRGGGAAACTAARRWRRRR